MRRYGPPTVSLALLLALAFVPAGAARAGSLRDDADFFSPEAEQRVTQLLDQIQQRRGKNVVVETYASPPSSIPTGGDEGTRNEAYHQWAVQRGQATRADVVVLITRNPSHLRVDSSRALKQSGVFTEADQTAAANAMLAAFRQKAYDQGILDGLAYIDRKLAAATGPERATGAAGAPTPSRSTGGSSANYPPPPGGSSAPPPSAPMRVGCGGGSMLCLVVAIIGAVLLVRSMMSRRSGYGGGFPVGGAGAPPPPPGPYGGGYGQPGYGQPSRGGFGSGFGGGILGGLLGGWLMNRSSHGSTGGAFGGDPAAPSHPQGLPPTDPSTFGGGGGDFGGGGGDFSGGGGDFGGGGGGGGGGDSGGGGDF
jgi:uncharacterized protein